MLEYYFFFEYLQKKLQYHFFECKLLKFGYCAYNELRLVQCQYRKQSFTVYK